MSSDLIAEWCEYHHNLHGISPRRRHDQLRELRVLEALLPGPVQTIDSKDLERFMMVKVQAGKHPHSVLQYLRLVKPFIRYMWQQGLIDAERWLRLQAVRGPRNAYDGQPRPYTRPELRQFWLELDQRYPWTRDREPSKRTPARGEHWVRRWAEGKSSYARVYPYARRLQVEATCALALYGGLRRREIYDISIENMHYASEYVRVIGARKGPNGHPKIRAVPMSPPLALAIGNWIEFRAQVLAPDHDFPWLCLWQGRGANADTTWVTKPISYTQFSTLFAEIALGWSYHRLRHTYATERYRAGMPIEILQQTMGHARIGQTLGYAKITEDRIIAASRATDDSFSDAIRPPDAAS